MTYQLLFLTILTIGLSCKSGGHENKTEHVTQDSGKTIEKVNENIRFDFTATRINTFEETIEILGTLFNDNSDTIYFLSSSCDGDQYLLHYDNNKFDLTPLLNCNVSFPFLKKIAPKSQHSFKAHFRCNSDKKKIKLGFYFNSVDKGFDIDKATLVDVYEIQNKPQTIIWADEKTIK